MQRRRVMERSVALIVTATVWVANVGITALAVYGLEHPRPYVPGPDTWQPSSEPLAKRSVATQGAAAKPAIIELPMMTIVGSRHGTAEMQGAPDVLIGPGTVTYPSTIPPHAPH